MNATDTRQFLLRTFPNMSDVLGRCWRGLLVALLVAVGICATPASAVQVLTPGADTPVSGQANSWFDGAIYVNPGTRELRITLGGGWGDADLYVRRGALSTSDEYDYRSWNTTNAESIVVANPAAGWWYISVKGFTTFGGASLRVATATQQAANVRISVRWRWERKYDGKYDVRVWITNKSNVNIRFDDFANVRLNNASRRVLANFREPLIRPGETLEETMSFSPLPRGRPGLSMLLRFDVLLLVDGESRRASNFGGRSRLP